METITIDGNEFAIFRQGRSTFRVLNIQANLDRFAKRLAIANKPLKTYAQLFEAEKRLQFKMTATPGERARAELYRDNSEFDIFTEPEVIEYEIPAFLELMAA